MSEDEGDEKERSIILLCFHNPARAHIYTCRYIQTHLHHIVHGHAHVHTHMHILFKLSITFSLPHAHTHVNTVSGEEESMQLAPGSPLCTHIHHSVVGLTEPSGPQAMAPHTHQLHTLLHFHTHTCTQTGEVEDISSTIKQQSCPQACELHINTLMLFHTVKNTFSKMPQNL